MARYNREIERRVLDIIKKEKIGATISDVVKLANINKITATKHLERLSSKNILVELNKPPVRIFIYKNKLNLK